MIFLRLFSRRWLLTTLIVIAAVGVLGRLGIWQLDRLEARRAFNARVLEQQEEDRLKLDSASIGLDLYSMEYRQVEVRGEYIPEEEIVLRNQSWGGELGLQLFTPLLIADTEHVIFVQRGWIPADQAEQKTRIAFVQEGKVTVYGLLRRAETDFGLRLRPDPTLAADQSRLDAWNNLDLDRLAAQIEYPLLPVYLQRQAEEEEGAPPYSQALSLELSEGSHLGYAWQWFSFATILALGYPFFVRRQEQQNAR